MRSMTSLRSSSASVPLGRAGPASPRSTPGIGDLGLERPPPPPRVRRPSETHTNGCLPNLLTRPTTSLNSNNLTRPELVKCETGLRMFLRFDFDPAGPRSANAESIADRYRQTARYPHRPAGRQDHVTHAVRRPRQAAMSITKSVLISQNASEWGDGNNGTERSNRHGERALRAAWGRRPDSTDRRPPDPTVVAHPAAGALDHPAGTPAFCILHNARSR
jgi:hypothetical protein